MGKAQLSVPDVSDLIWVCRRLAAALQGNDSVVVALDAIAGGASPRARQFLQAMRRAAESGQRMGQALMGVGVPPFAGALVWVGEARAALVICLTRLAELLETEQQLPAPRDPLLFAYGLAFSRIAVMLKEGVPVLQAFEAAAQSTAAPEVETTLLEARVGISQGLLLGNVLPNVTEDLPPIVIEIITDGEVTGRLDDVLAIAADYLFDEAGRKEA